MRTQDAIRPPRNRDGVRGSDARDADSGAVAAHPVVDEAGLSVHGVWGSLKNPHHTLKPVTFRADSVLSLKLAGDIASIHPTKAPANRTDAMPRNAVRMVIDSLLFFHISRRFRLFHESLRTNRDAFFPDTTPPGCAADAFCAAAFALKNSWMFVATIAI